MTKGFRDVKFSTKNSIINWTAYFSRHPASASFGIKCVI